MKCLADSRTHGAPVGSNSPCSWEWSWIFNLPACLHFPSVGITGLCHHVCLSSLTISKTVIISQQIWKGNLYHITTIFYLTYWNNVLFLSLLFSNLSPAGYQSNFMWTEVFIHEMVCLKFICLLNMQDAADIMDETRLTTDNTESKKQNPAFKLT